MVVLVGYGFCVLPFEAKGDAPAPADIHGPGTRSTSFELVKLEAGKVHILGPCSRMEPAEDQTESLRVSGLDSGDIPGFEKEPEAFVPEASNHSPVVTYPVTGDSQEVRTQQPPLPRVHIRRTPLEKSP